MIDHTDKQPETEQVEAPSNAWRWIDEERDLAARLAFHEMAIAPPRDPRTITQREIERGEYLARWRERLNERIRLYDVIDAWPAEVDPTQADHYVDREGRLRWFLKRHAAALCSCKRNMTEEVVQRVAGCFTHSSRFTDADRGGE